MFSVKIPMPDSCDDCPPLDIRDDPESGGYYGLAWCLAADRQAYTHGSTFPQDWCPLRHGPVTITAEH